MCIPELFQILGLMSYIWERAKTWHIPNKKCQGIWGPFTILYGHYRNRNAECSTNKMEWNYITVPNQWSYLTWNYVQNPIQQSSGLRMVPQALQIDAIQTLFSPKNPQILVSRFPEIGAYPFQIYPGPKGWYLYQIWSVWMLSGMRGPCQCSS